MLTYNVSLAQEMQCPEDCPFPDCYCLPKQIPGNMTRDNTPQMVLVTFSDAMIDKDTLEKLQLIFNKKRRNANKCPVAMTAFVSDNATDYCAVHRLYADGHEMASYSLTRRTPTDWWSNVAGFDDWKNEMVTQREKIADKGKVPEGNIVGARAPYWTPGGDEMFRMLEINDFTYDSSLLVKGGANPLWPFTLDFKFKEVADQNCLNPRCPDETHTLWEIPINYWSDNNNKRCTFLDACLADTEKSTAAVVNIIWKNFNRHYDSNRAPFMINIRRTALVNKRIFSAITEFIDQVSQRDDIWVVTMQECLEWMQQPTPLKDIAAFEPWKCKSRRFNSACRPTEKIYLIEVIGISGRDLVIIECVLLAVIFVILVKRDQHTHNS